MLEKAALIIPTDSDGRVLLQHKDDGAPSNPNTWCLFGGGVKEGESYEQAIRRELIEELDLALENIKFVMSHDDNLIQRRIFTAKIHKTSDELLPKLTEGDNLGFFNWLEIKNLNVAEPHRKILAEFFR